MVTDTARHQAELESQGLFSRAAGQMRQLFCGLHGHDALLHFDHGRMSLLCTSCGYESPGWDVKEAPARRQHAEASPMVRLPLVGGHRVA